MTQVQSQQIRTYTVPWLMHAEQLEIMTGKKEKKILALFVVFYYC